MPERFEMQVFLGGPIQALTDDPVLLANTKSVLLQAIEHFQANGIEVFSAHLVEEFGDKTHEWTPTAVTQRDIMWMRTCDVFIAVLPRDSDGRLARTDGTHIELGWASALNKPIILVMDPEVEEESSHLVKGLSSVARVTRLSFQTVQDDPERLLSLAYELQRRRKEEA